MSNLIKYDSMQKESRLKSSAIAFSVKLVQLYDCIERKAFIKNQLARAGTSIGANIHEAEYAESTVDFIHKLGIALKECNETEYWLLVLAESCPELSENAAKLRNEAGGIRRMLISTITTIKGKIAEKEAFAR